MGSQALTLIDRIALVNSTTSIPYIGFGVYKIRGPACTAAVIEALSAGYRHIDSAALYRNEHEDGYVDLLLIHVPGPSHTHREKLWAAMERLRNEGRAKSIGVSNFRVRHLEEMREYAAAWPPSVNQIELHPWCQQRDVVAYCQTHGIIVEAYSPLATGTRLDDPTVQSMATKKGKTPAQILIRYALQKGWVPLPKSVQPDRIHENLDVFNFDLDQDDMAALDALDEGSKGAVFKTNVD
ncbi:Aldo-ket-red domain-containing protein [Fusarium keratoplasticum]|nr:Aldo-ket-red domain-containing protein [Fusarium keratoplasticum]